MRPANKAAIGSIETSIDWGDMRIAFMAEPDAPGGWYRSIGPMVALGHRGHEIRQVITADDEFRPERVRGCDLLQVYREHDARALDVIQYAKGAGIAVAWDNDDDLTNVPKSNPAHRRFTGVAGTKAQLAIKRIVRTADVVTAPSAVLCGHYREQGAANVELVENYVRDGLLAQRAHQHRERVVIGWLAGAEHHVDVERVPIREAAAHLLDTHPSVQVVTIGVGLGLSSERYRHVRHVNLWDLARELVHFDVGLAVIADIPFNHGRSNIKLKDYAALGIPWLASPIGPYAGMSERQGGRLVPDEDWYDAMERLVIRTRERRKLAKRALAWGRAQTIGANVERWEQVLQAAVRRAVSTHEERGLR